jgi:hypothetical protein
MKKNPTPTLRTRTWSSLLFISLLVSLSSIFLIGGSPAVASGPEPQQLKKPWTAVGSSGAVDEDSINRYAFGSAEITFKPGAAGSVVTARYNVTNTFDNGLNPNAPGWHTLEMGSTTPNSTIIEAKLFQIKACDTTPVLLCTARNRSNDHPCATCTFNQTIDFGTSLYYVEVTLNRFNQPNSQPKMFTLRLF